MHRAHMRTSNRHLSTVAVSLMTLPCAIEPRPTFSFPLSPWDTTEAATPTDALLALNSENASFSITHRLIMLASYRLPLAVPRATYPQTLPTSRNFHPLSERYTHNSVALSKTGISTVHKVSALRISSSPYYGTRQPNVATESI